MALHREHHPNATAPAMDGAWPVVPEDEKRDDDNLDEPDDHIVTWDEARIDYERELTRQARAEGY